MESLGRRFRAFTLIELLVVISIIAMLVGILLPAIGAARKMANQMKGSTELRSIHEQMSVFANGNHSYLPGVDRNGGALTSTDTSFLALSGGNTGGPSGAAINTRFYILLNGNYLAGDMLVSPVEIAPKWTDPSQLPNTKQYSYSLLRLLDTTALGANEVAMTANAGRLSEWRDNATSQAVMGSDRNTQTDATIYSTTPHSIWSNGLVAGGDWAGNVVWGDNHVNFLSNSQFTGLVTSYGGIVTTGDNLFSDSDANHQGSNAFFGHISDNY